MKRWGDFSQASIILPPIPYLLRHSRFISVNKTRRSLSTPVVMLKDDHLAERGDLVEIFSRLGSRLIKGIRGVIEQDRKTYSFFISSEVKSFFHYPSSLKSAATLSILLKARLAIPGGRYLKNFMTSTYRRQDISCSTELSFLKTEVKENESSVCNPLSPKILDTLDPFFHLLLLQT